MSKLNDFCINITDGEHGSVVDAPNGSYFLLSNKNLIDGHIVITNNDRKIDKTTFDTINRRTNLSKGDVLIATVGTIGKTAIITDNEINYVFQRSVGIIKTDPSKLDPYYLMYLLNTPLYQKKFNLIAKGGVQRCIFISDLMDLEVSIPSLEVQKQTIKLLKLIDSKIDCNKEIERTLHALIKDYFNYWFVQFDFPNEKGRPYKTSGGILVNIEGDNIPTGWKKQPLNSILSLLKDGTHNPPKRVEQGIPLLTGTMFSDYFLNYSKATYISKDDYEKIHKSYQPQAGDLILTKIGTIGNVNILNADDIPIAIHCNSALLRFKPEYDGVFGLNLLKSDTFQVMLRNNKGQSIQEFISLGKLEELKVVVPPVNIIENFKQICDPMLNKLRKVHYENLELINLKDFLLPLLMNGLVSFKEV